ncbi:hypothetical protein LCGC14_1666200 [marine sediment metagenome]|uniref:HNH domain-containing protein n=1 Tax=marine sediment metagenome TaxID=412755 RepID=A0A0F9HTB1_9ZZZZ
MEKLKISQRLEGLDLIREKIRNRDNYQCQCGLGIIECPAHDGIPCGKIWNGLERRFDVHHLDTDFESTNNYNFDKLHPEILITLCHRCHLNLPHIQEKKKLSTKK